jgi:hypothetical protein
MDVHLKNPDIKAKIDRWVAETGRGPDELIEDAIAGYFEELTQTQEMLNSRYDDLKSGRGHPGRGGHCSLARKERSSPFQQGSSREK